jgi:calcineurin-like phosphoesterase
MPVNFPVARGEVKLHGLLVDIDEPTGRALAVTRVAEVYRPSQAAVEGTPARHPETSLAK